MELEFWSYEEMETWLKEFHETQPEFGISIRRVMDGGRFFVKVEQEEPEEQD